MNLAIMQLMMTVLSFANDGGGHHAEGVPTSFIGIQALNLGILLAILFYVLRKPVVEHFEARKSTFLTALNKAETARREAESQKAKIAEQLAELKGNAEKSLSQARAEAEELKRQIIREAETLSQTLKQEADRTVRIEVEKAKVALRNELLEQAMQTAEGKLSSQMAEQDQLRLQNEFVEKIQVAR